MTARHARWGAAALAVYLLAAFASFRLGLVPQLPLYDGLAPPAPYNWVDPPPDLVDENIPASSGTGRIGFTPEGSQARSVATDDGQCQIIFPIGVFAPDPATGLRAALPSIVAILAPTAAHPVAAAVEGSTDDVVVVEITPIDPDPLPQAPGDLQIAGNAYRITATYGGTGAPAVFDGDATIILRYPVHATLMLRLEGDGFERLQTDQAGQDLKLFAGTTELGTFAAAGVPVVEGGGGPPLWAIVVSGVLLAAAAFEAWRYRQRRRASAPASRAPRRRRPR